MPLPCELNTQCPECMTVSRLTRSIVLKQCRERIIFLCRMMLKRDKNIFHFYSAMHLKVCSTFHKLYIGSIHYPSP